ncbi:hypothetical protein K431DRAFT_283020 [Polychaeton citri CBS 116435]|uniref:D-isomer specific 2-hydroxyacid dehydrogenase NAD-binding domain-containing protein n=1 Tax=Polychaeton citri CBS 116435 TaxID=1314669 RepID=A0A9P4QCJ7_9PEZI|nr:hypothetical protein K431DRAFT_283020 [Polychaeton citri CBS 116435]
MGGGPPKETLYILLPQPEPQDVVSSLRKKFPNVDIVYRETTFQVALSDPLPEEAWKDVTLLFTFNTIPSHASFAPRLALIQLASAGSNHIQNSEWYKDTDVAISTATGIHGPQIAEWVVLTALVQSHKYKTLYELQKKHEWGKRHINDDITTVKDKVGRRLGVLGYGSIGRQVGRVAKALGMDVYAFTATPKDTPEKRKDGGFIVPGTGDPDGEIPSKWFSGLDKASLHKFLEQDIDWLVVSVPLTKQTKHFLSTEEFKKLSRDGKKPAFVTNIARGPIIDQPALIEALKDGTLEGAALDVTDPEPLPADSELWDLKNAIVTPHVSGNGVSYMERAFGVLEENMRRKERGEKLLNLVSRDRGY